MPGTGGCLTDSPSPEGVEALVSSLCFFEPSMNLFRFSNKYFRLVYRAALSTRHFLGKQRCRAFGDPGRTPTTAAVGRIFVINLDRQPHRWRWIVDELNQILDASGLTLSHRTTRVSAVDAREDHDHAREGLVETTYTLGDQLFVDPHPLACPDRLNLDERIEMTPQEVAVACSHVDVWRRIASGPDTYALVLEDDVWFDPRFATLLNKVWSELHDDNSGASVFDVLYVSYQEVDYGAEKVWVSKSLFSPFRGLWHMSGYVLSKSGAERLLSFLPIRGPVDLWMNHRFDRLKVYGTAKPIIRQRPDEKSTNSYSILPVLSRVGIINNEKPGLFLGSPLLRPVFAFGASRSGLSSLAMGLSMLGYRCCSDVDGLPDIKMQRLLKGDPDRVFDAYVNVGGLREHLGKLANVYPQSRLIVTVAGSGIAERGEPYGMISSGDHVEKIYVEVLNSDAGIGAWRDRTLVLPFGSPRVWKLLCQFLRCVPPPASYPYCEDLGQRSMDTSNGRTLASPLARKGKMPFDESPWVASPLTSWRGVPLASVAADIGLNGKIVDVFDDFSKSDVSLWTLRDDTFPGNLALFRPSNFIPAVCDAAQLVLRQDNTGVRKYSSAALHTRASFLYGRFEAILKPPRVPGVVTGVFLHRNSPRQEIDIEFVGKRSWQMLTNVFYNPGTHGARFDYGYRGTPIFVNLGFDYAEDYHQYAIEWLPNELRWYVDGHIVHRRVNWEPTPIPHLPMQFHLNLWPSRSTEFAGRLRSRYLPTSCSLKSTRLRPVTVVEPERFVREASDALA
jgi:GR25 family glycosyltransferase involved in LPS biosynthesis